jgi:hypothetical protein
MEDTNGIWERLCFRKYGAKRSEVIPDTGETWKEGFVRLANEQDDRLKRLTNKISE